MLAGDGAATDVARNSFQLDADYQEFQGVCRAFVQRQVQPLVRRAEETGRFPEQLWAQLAANGFLGLGFDEALGGSGGGHLAISLFSEELSKASGGIAVTVLVSAYMAAPHLGRFGTPEQKLAYLTPVIMGKQIAAIAVTEPAAGSDVAGITAVAKRSDGGYRLRGTKMFITNGGIADYVIVAAKTDPSAGHRGISTFIVERGRPGFSVGRPLHKMGWHSSDTRELIFDDCFVPESQVLGTVNRGFYQIMEAFQTERVVVAAMGIGLAQAAFDDALAYARERQAFGQSIGKYQSVRHRLSEMATDIEAARLLTYRAAAELDGDRDAGEAVAMAKLMSARVANRVVDDAVQIFGGYGFLEETPVAMHYRDARVLRIGAGTDETQMEILAKRMGL
jgi:acyl-CoA dehydrogenase/citronellyl-CoA dehydrogenase